MALVHFAEENGRTRRLEPGGEERLKKHAPCQLHALIVAALETGCRKGELLDLQWRDVKWQQNVLLLPADKTKTAEDRDVPMTTSLKAVLEMRRHAPDGEEHRPDDYVFGNEVGEKTRDIREVWAQTCEAADIRNLHFHDLRREFASRLTESGASVHEVAAWLGHANISTTSRYLKATRSGLQRGLNRFEEYQKRRAKEEEEYLNSRAAERKARSIRTRFAHVPAEETSTDSPQSTPDHAN